MLYLNVLEVRSYKKTMIMIVWKKVDANLTIEVSSGLGAYEHICCKKKMFDENMTPM